MTVMTRYVALLRGIGPTNPNMRGEKLCGVLEKLGFANVSAVINSGNIVFDSKSSNVAAMEEKIEKAWPTQLGFKSTTIIRSQNEIEQLIKRKPFGKAAHGAGNYLLVTFLKKHSSKLRTMQKKGSGFHVHAVYKREFCTAIDLKNTHTPDLMRDAEKTFGKEITSRTWKTIERIHKRMTAA